MPVRKNSSKKADVRSFKEEMIHEFHVISEGIIGQVKQVAEGVTNLDEKLERARQGLKAEIEEKTEPIAHAVVSLDRKVTSLDGKVETVDEKVTSLDGKVKTVDEKVTSLDGKVKTLDEKVTSLDGKVKTLDEKVTSLDSKVNGLDKTVNVLDGKLDRTYQELKNEIQETKQEILAAVKFSYAELDKRLTTLEKEFFELRLRVEKIESRSTS